MQRAFVTGAAGFIGSSLCDRLLEAGIEVVGWDNFSTGQEAFIESAKQHSSFVFRPGNNLDQEQLQAAITAEDWKTVDELTEQLRASPRV